MKKFHIGTMGWSYDFWKGNFYTEGAKDLLAEYSKNFDTVEIDSTFYRIPTRETVIKWKDEVPDEFIFSVKFPRKITHVNMLRDCKEELNVFKERMSLLGNKLGPMLLQFPPSFKPEMSDILKDFLSILPHGYRFAVEVRNKKWLNDKFYDILRNEGVALALIDHPWMIEMNTVTADFTYIRWVGDRKKVNGTLGKTERDRSVEINTWGKKIQNYIENSVDVYGYFGKTYSGFPPQDVKMLLTNIESITQGDQNE